MAFRYLDHIADIGIEVETENLDELFSEGVQGLLSLFFDTTLVKPKKKLLCSAEEESIEYLFVALMNAVIAVIGQTGYCFNKCETVKITQGKTCTATIKLHGEPLDRTRHDVKTEVKAATYSGLAYTHKKNKHKVRCLFDV
jgi:SHS2 domain-containing protein